MPHPFRKMIARATLPALALSLAASGCAASGNTVSAQLLDIQREITSLRADNLIMKDRLETLEEEAEAGGVARTDNAGDDSATAASEPPDRSDRPNLAVVRLTPEMGPSVASPGATTTAAEGEQPLQIVGDAKGVKQQQAGVSGRGGPSFRRK